MINLAEVKISAIRSRGKGGQNVNKLNTGVHLHFDIKRSSLDANAQEILLALSDIRLSKDGVIVIKADRFRTQEKNRLDAIKRLNQLIERAQLKQMRKKVRF